MNATTLACTPSGLTWRGIHRIDVQRQAGRLQARIVKATQEGRPKKVQALQCFIYHGTYL